MSRPLPLLIAAALALTLGACSGSDEPDSETPLPTIESARNAELPVRPGDFCERIDERAVEAVVGEEPESAHYGNGEKAEIAPGVTDVAHEFGCVFTSTTGSQARAWVAVPPVTAAQAAKIAPGRKCTDAGVGLGEPGFAATCTTKHGTTTTLAGLYTDTWFGCSLTEQEPTTTTTERLERWCAAAVQAAATAD
ncbi:hypothetical protein [Nocardioides alcanivorans]|uniref:hypothetical protein n=1 Tax=Nocardioides alcanivorans TaxID=2897352 RepID=UPI001F1D37B1|nr:hypothetical protein [Nocardioides alcanivorans]